MRKLRPSVLRLASALCLACGSRAVPNPLPAPTLFEFNPFEAVLGWSPIPTSPPLYEPRLDLLKRDANDLDKRQADLSSGQLIGYFGQDSTCGFVSGTLGASLTCSQASRCAAVAPVGNADGAMGCCPTAGSGCYWITTCYDAAALSASKCDNACMQDKNVRRCSGSLPFCSGLSWPDLKATLWGCGSTSQSSFDLVSTTFLGQADKHSYIPQYYTPSAGDSTNLFPTSILSGSSKTSSSPGPTTTAPSGGKTNVGAIVGGVVGGLAVVAVSAFGVVFLFLRRRRARKEVDASSAPSGTTPDPATGAAVGAGAGAGYYGAEGKQEAGPGPQSPPGGQYTAYHDNRASAMSYDTVPPYPSPGFAPPPPQPYQPAPIELSSDQTAPQKIYEAPGS